MKQGTSGFYIKNLDDEIKRKAVLVVKSKGTTLSEIVRNTIERLAKQYNEDIEEEE